jgi:cytochrome c-type biogenesis protein CcmH
MKFLVLIAVLLLGVAAQAVEPSEMLADPKLEARAREVSQALRCVVCQNETIDESHAEIAGDMRKMVRQRITAGDSNDQILRYMLERYGDFVLLKPRFTGVTLVLWCGPPLLLLLGFLMVRRRLRNPGVGPAPLTAEEQVTLAALKTDPTGERRP